MHVKFDLIKGTWKQYPSARF